MSSSDMPYESHSSTSVACNACIQPRGCGDASAADESGSLPNVMGQAPVPTSMGDVQAHDMVISSVAEPVSGEPVAANAQGTAHETVAVVSAESAPCPRCTTKNGLHTCGKQRSRISVKPAGDRAKRSRAQPASSDAAGNASTEHAGARQDSIDLTSHCTMCEWRVR